MEEDVLYQKGASFSAKLDDTNQHNTNLDNNNLDESDLDDELTSDHTIIDEDDDEWLNENSLFNDEPINSDISDMIPKTTPSPLLSLPSTKQTPKPPSAAAVQQQSTKSTNNVTPNNMETTIEVTLPSEIIHDEFYSKEDMSVYDDVNNNKLNIKNIHYTNSISDSSSDQSDTVKSYIQIQEYVTSTLRSTPSSTSSSMRYQLNDTVVDTLSR